MVGVDDGLNFHHTISREAGQASVFPDQILVGRDTGIIDLVASDDALYPLDIGPQSISELDLTARRSISILGLSARLLGERARSIRYLGIS